MKKFTLLLEELNIQQQEYLKNKLGGDKYNPEKSHPNMFDSYQDKNDKNRITLPLETSNLNDKVNPEIKIHLMKHGWNIHNYHAGLVSRNTVDRDGNDKLEIRKIGKVLQQTGGDKVYHTQPRDRLIKGSDGKPLIGSDGRMKSEKVKQSLSDFYNTDPIRDSSKVEHNIVISRDLDDIGGMTSGRTWESTSCMRLPYGNIPEHSNHQHIKDDLDNHTLVAYATKRGDDELENPVGRVLIKKYISTKPINRKYHVIYRTENKAYGNPPDGFRDQVEDLMKQHYPAENGVSYKLHADLYSDGRADITPKFVGKHISGATTKNYNENGELHDYIDEHGVKQPAVSIKDDEDFSHYKNGKLHNENGVAKHDLGTSYHAINGEYHREGDLPAVYIDNGSFKMEKYYKGGILHRDGDNPTIIQKDDDDGNYTEEYYKFGLLHREGDKPAIIKNRNGITEEHYYKNGLLHRDGDKPAVIENFKDGGSILAHYKNGLLHRDGDKPAKISVYNNGNNMETKYYKNGELHRDGNEPASTTIIKDGGMKHIYNHWYENNNIKKEENIIYDGDTLHLHEIKNYNSNGHVTNVKTVRKNSTTFRDNYATGDTPSSIVEDDKSIEKSYNRHGDGLTYEYIPKKGNTAHKIKKYKKINTIDDDTIISSNIPSDDVFHKNEDGIHYIDNGTNTVTTLTNNGDILHSKIPTFGEPYHRIIGHHMSIATKIDKNDLPDLESSTNRILDRANANGIDDNHINIIKQFNNGIK